MIPFSLLLFNALWHLLRLVLPELLDELLQELAFLLTVVLLEALERKRLGIFQCSLQDTFKGMLVVMIIWKIRIGALAIETVAQA